MNEKSESLGMVVHTQSSGSLAVSAMAAKAKAEVEARYTIALHRPRSFEQARDTILAACERPEFAKGALYRKPVGGGKTVDGLSIRFAEEALKAMTNICTDAMIVWDDEEKRQIRVTVTDLETNTTYTDEILISKTVERRALKDGQEKLGERLNSYGDKVFIVAATEDDMANKVNAAKSKIIRNNGLRLVPQDILEEAEALIWHTLEKGGADSKAEVKKICDAFSAIGVKPKDLERYLGHTLDSISPKELVGLRGIYTAIKDQETTWKAVMEQATPKTPAATGDAPVIPASTTPAVDPAILEKPYESLMSLLKWDEVSQAQVIAYCKDPARGLCSAKCEEVAQMKEDSMRTLIVAWSNIVSALKAIKV